MSTELNFFSNTSQVWFQNRRAKAKRERHGGISECCSNDTETELTEAEDEQSEHVTEHVTEGNENKDSEQDVDVD